MVLRGKAWWTRAAKAPEAGQLTWAAGIAMAILVICFMWRNEEARRLSRYMQEFDAERISAQIRLPSERTENRDFSATFEDQRLLNDLMTDAGKVSERHGVALLSVDLKRRDTPGEQDLIGARFALVMTGNYPALKAVLADLWITRGNWQIRNLSMRQIPGADRVELQLQIFVFMR